MSLNATDNDINLLGLVIPINVDSKLLFLYKFKSFRFWQAKWSAMYNKVPLAVDSVGVNSKDKFGIFAFFAMLVSLSILVSKIAIMSKLMLADLIKYSRSSKFLFKEQVLMWNKKRQLFLLGFLIDWTSSKLSYLHLTTFSGSLWSCVLGVLLN